MQRSIEKHLEQWVAEPDRKVLLLRGARQVGKTYSVRRLGEKFKHYLEVNFESDRSVHHFFAGDLDPEQICRNLGAYYDIPVIEGKTLLFFDEIQACLPAISSLRFFYEKKRNLHVIAAGSLIEFALQDLPSFGIGRIQSLYMYPMSFAEFLLATGAGKILEHIRQIEGQEPVNEAFHLKLIHYLKEFLFIGGLPEVVQAYLGDRDLRKAQDVLDRLISGFEDDFAKYKRRVPAYRLREVFHAVVKQSGHKFNLSRAAEGTGVEQVKQSLGLLEMAGLVYMVKHSSSTGIPLGAGVDHRKFKVLGFDHGVFQRLLGLDLREYLLTDNIELIHKGNLAEQFAGTEIIKYAGPLSRHQLYYWHREIKGSHAEVDYVVQRSDSVVPVEIKAGTQGKMQSMWMFMKEKNPAYGIRCSLENFSLYQDIRIIPLYAMEKV